jgi:hypothetical protein
MAEHGWLVNPKRRRRKKRMPAGLARYWAKHRRTKKKTRSHSRRKRRVTTRGYGVSSLPSHYRRKRRATRRRKSSNPFYSWNPSLIKEVGMFGNPRRHRRRRSHRYHHNPKRHRRSHGGGSHGVGVMTMVKDPMGTVTKGLVGSVGVFLPIATANWLLPFPGTDIMSRLLRFATRAAAGGLIVSFGSKFVGRSAEALKIGAFIGVAGSTVLDFLGTRVVLGLGDTQQVPMQLLAGFSAPAAAPVVGTAGLGAAYTKRLGVGAAYSKALGLRGLHGGGAIGTGFKHGLFGSI